MTKKKLVHRVHRTLRVTTRQAEEIVVAVFGGIMNGIIEDGYMSMRGFGKWRVLEKSERAGRNPRNGEPAVISARRVVKFKAGNILKREVNRRRKK